MRMSAKAVERSENRKLGIGKCSATYVSQASCPTDCPLLHKGCYAEKGTPRFATFKVNQSPERESPIELAQAESKAIDSLSGKFPLRLHVVGDCAGLMEANLVSMAAERYQAKHQQPVWTFTHAHHRVPRAAWRNISVLASCHSLEEVEAAHQAGYAASLVSNRLPPTQGKAWKESCGEKEFTLIPCPQQSGKAKDCISCRLCFRDDKLHAAKAVIVFKKH